MTCFFLDLGYVPCGGRTYDGILDRCHLVPADRIRKAGLPIEAEKDPRIIVQGCGRHHHQFDIAKTIRLRRDQYPDSVQKWADEWGFYWAGEGKGWLKEA